MPRPPAPQSIPGPISIPSGLTQVTPSNPPRSHRASSLMKIPTETRLMILRHLLTRDQPVGRRARYEITVEGPKRDAKGRFIKRTMTKEQVQGYNLTPSILRTCQKLLAEGLPILYHQNTLQLSISIGGPGLPWGSALSTLAIAPRGRFNTMYIVAQMLAFANQRVLYCQGDGLWVHDKELTYIARRFGNFSITVGHSPDTLHHAQLRSLLRQSSSIFDSRNVKLTVDWTFSLSPAPLPYNLGPLQLRTINAFTLLRCANFQLLRITDSAALAVENIITTKGDVVVDLEQFLPRIGSVLQMLVESKMFPKQEAQLLALMSKLIEATGDFDTRSFFEARHEILSIWWSIRKQFNLEKDKSKKQYLRLLPGLEEYHITKTPYGFLIDEDGEVLNAPYRYTVVRIDFKPDYKSINEASSFVLKPPKTPKPGVVS